MITEKDWKKIQREYVTGSVSYGTLAKKYGVSKGRLGNVAWKGKWVQKRSEYREQMNNKTLQALSNEAAVAEEVNHFLTVQKAAEKGALMCLVVMEDLDKYRNRKGRIDPQDLRNLMAALKDAQHIIRTAYDIPTRVEMANLDIARQKLELEKQKANAVEVDDNETGIVIIPEREAVDE